MKTSSRHSRPERSVPFCFDLMNRTVESASRKRRRPGYCYSKIMPIGTMATATTSKSLVASRLGTSWRFLLVTFFLVVKAASSSSNSINTSIDNEHHSESVYSQGNSPHLMDSSFTAIRQAIDDAGKSFIRKAPLALLEQQPEEEKVILDDELSHSDHDWRDEDFPTLLSSASSPSSWHQPGYRYLRGSSERTRKRFRKDRNFAGSHFPVSTEDRHRIFISCDKSQSQEDCLSKLLGTYDSSYIENNHINNDRRHRIQVIHNLKSIHTLSVDVDTETLSKMVMDNEFELEKDFARGPLVVEGSISFHQPSNDKRNRNLQDSQEIPWGLDAIHAQEVWREFGVRGEGVKICVLDSGVQASHEDFRQSHFDGYYGKEFVSPNWYEDRKGHGTHIAGTIAASDNTVGIVGIAPEAETYIVRVFDDDRKFYGFADGTAYSTDLIAAATICKEWGADIINASLGGNSYNRIEEEFFKDLYYESGILTVAASGNGGDNRNVYPAAYEGVLSVGAVDESLRIAKFSTWDPSTTDVFAPGVNILSTFKDNIYATSSGTSMAAPHATGALALMLSYIKETHKDINAQDIFHALKNTVASIDTSEVDRKKDSNDSADSSHAMGVIDAYASVKYLEGYDKDAKERSPLITVKDPSTNRCQNEVRLEINTDSKGGEIYYRLKNLSDNQVIWMTRPNTLKSDSKYLEKACFEGPEDCYQFDIRDTGGDGISDGGGIEIVYNGHKLYRGANFGRGGGLKFGDCQNGDRI